MTVKYLLDTDICIYAINLRHPKVVAAFDAYSGQMAVSDITVFELAYGAEKSSDPLRNLSVLDGFLARLEIHPFNTKAAYQAGRVRADLERDGTPIGSFDLLIAGQARSSGLILVTNNTREFERVPGLQVENWI